MLRFVVVTVGDGKLEPSGEQPTAALATLVRQLYVCIDSERYPHDGQADYEECFEAFRLWGIKVALQELRATPLTTTTATGASTQLSKALAPKPVIPSSCSLKLLLLQHAQNRPIY